MLQNRVTPTGAIIATPARGAWLGNRGQLHGRGKTILRTYKHQAWITCLLSFKNRHRELMSPGLWTELFFLDEATAFSAGHRPCFECRRADAVRFKNAWIAGNPGFGFSMKTPIGLIDEILQAERIDNNHQKRTYTANGNDLPGGAFILLDGQPHLVANNRIYQWTPSGYEQEKEMPPGEIDVLTPQSFVNAFRHGYEPQTGLTR